MILYKRFEDITINNSTIKFIFLFYFFVIFLLYLIVFSIVNIIRQKQKNDQRVSFAPPTKNHMLKKLIFYIQ